LTNAVQIKTAFGVGCAILLGLGVATSLQTYVWEDSAGWVSHTWDVLSRLDEMALRSRSAEGAARSLARAFVPSELARCRQDLARAHQIVHDIQWLTADNPSQQRRHQTLQELAALQAAALNAGLSSNSAEGVSRALDDYDRAAIGARLGGILGEMQTEERSLLGIRVERHRRVAQRSRELSQTAAGISLVLVMLAALRTGIDLKKRRLAEGALAEREEQYRQVVEMAGDIVYRTDHLGRFTFCNQTALSMLRLTERELLGRSYLKLVRHDKRKETARFYVRQFARRRQTSYFEFPIVDGHGRERWMGQNVQLLMEGGAVTGLHGIAREITEQKLAEQDLRKSRAFVERIAATTPGILYVYDLDERRNVYSNREVTSVLGYQSEEVASVTDPVLEYVHPEDVPAIRSHHEALRQAPEGEVRRIQYRARHARGHWVWLAARDTPFERNAAGVVTQIVGIAQDITARKAAQDELAYQANFDALTGLANRAHFWTRLQGVLRRASMEHATASLCILDIDLFKEINDRFGHASGDEVLESLGGIMRSELRSNDLAGRLGGDEFAFVLPDADDRDAAGIAERIRERLETVAFGLAAGVPPFSVTATFGVAEWCPSMDAKALLEAADRALYQAKSSGRNRVCVNA
jgi:diguanylate cyclase (GGDEF)-like protein/PAS domain S-box-containing protein